MSIERRYSLLKHDHNDLYYTEAEVDAIVDDYLPLAGGTLTGDLVITDADPRLVLQETGVTADEGRWELLANGEELHLRAVTDADGSQKDILYATRTGSAIASVNYGNATDNPTHSMYGNLRLGAGAAPSASVGSLSQYMSLNGDTNNDHIGLELYVADGTNNQRLWLFNDDSTNYVGIDFTYTTGLNAFVIRRAGTSVFQINAAGSQITMSPGGNPRAYFDATSAQALGLAATDSVGDCYIGFFESNAFSTRKGYIGYAATTTDDFYILNEETGTARIFIRTSATASSNSEIAIQPGANNILRMQDSASGLAMGFFGGSPIVKPTVTGSRGGNAALASLCTALANLGLITNSTT